MNPTDDEIDYKILSNEELAEIATSRLRQMLAWDPEEVLRDQLREASVSKSRIDALYPFNFSNLCEPLKKRMSAGSLSHLTNGTVLNWVVDETNRQMGPLTQAHKDLIDPENPPIEFTARIEALQFHVLNCLPPEPTKAIGRTTFARSTVSPEENRKSWANTLVVVLWYATSIMAHLDAIQPRDAVDVRRSIHEYFCKVTDIALPSFKVFEQARGAIASYNVTTWY